MKSKCVVLECSVCGTQFERLLKHYWNALKNGQKSFRCSRACTGERNAITFSCGQCGKEIQRTPSIVQRSKSGNYFCSRSCATKKNNTFKVQEKHPNWNGGSDYRQPHLIRQPRCVSCTVSRTYLLQVHHIDGNRKNSDHSNLETVCMTCHGMRHLAWQNGQLVSRWNALTTFEIAQYLAQENDPSPIYFPRPRLTEAAECWDWHAV